MEVRFRNQCVFCDIFHCQTIPTHTLNFIIALWWPEIPVIVAIIVATVAMAMVCFSVYKTEKASNRWCQTPNTNSTMLRAGMIQYFFLSVNDLTNHIPFNAHLMFCHFALLSFFLWGDLQFSGSHFGT